MALNIKVRAGKKLICNGAATILFLHPTSIISVPTHTSFRIGQQSFVIIDDGCHYLFPRAAKLSILGQKVALIYGHQIIEPENATTDATKAYLGFQSAYVGYPAKIDSFDLSKAIAAIMSSSQENRVDMEAAQACLDEGNGLEALKKIREIIRRDEASPRLSNVASEVLVPAQTIASVEFIPSAHSTPLPEAGKAMRLPERPTRLSKDSLVANAIRRAPEIYRQG